MCCVHCLCVVLHVRISSGFVVCSVSVVSLLCDVLVSLAQSISSTLFVSETSSERPLDVESARELLLHE